MRKRFTLLELLVALAIGMFLVVLIAKMIKPPPPPAFHPGDIVEVVLDQRRAIVLRSQGIGILAGQVEVRIANTEEPAQLYEHELRLIEKAKRPKEVSAPSGSVWKE